jgi:pseudaminic acid synthase
MIVGRQKIENFGKPFIIAELSGNHCGKLDEILRMIKTVYECGVDAIKLQSFKANTITFESNDDYFKLANGSTMFEVYKKFETPYSWYDDIFTLCNNLGILCFSSPFDETAVEVLEKYDCPLYKIASFEIGHFPLLEKIMKTGKPIIASIGMTYKSELDEFMNIIKNNNYIDKIALLQCTSAYPTPYDELNLNMIPELQKLYNVPVGLSDHSLGVSASIGAVSLGCALVEKHFTLDKNNGGADSFMSLEPDELSLLVKSVSEVNRSMGSIHWGPTKSESSNTKFKRSIFVVTQIKKGDIFTEENIKIIRPGDGLEPKFYSKTLGKKAKVDIESGTPLNLSMIID